MKKIYNLKQPMAIGIEITNTCSARCSFCGFSKGIDKREKDQLDESKFDWIMQLIAGSNKKHTVSIHAISGDPTCHDNFALFLRLARQNKNIGTLRAITNGVLLNKFILKSLLTNISVLDISTSLVDRESYYRLYGVDKYVQVLDNIRNVCTANSSINNPADIHLLLRIDKPFSKFFESPLYSELKDKVTSIKTLDRYDSFDGVVKKEDLPKGSDFVGKRAIDQKVSCSAFYRSLQILHDGTIQLCTCRIKPELQANNIVTYKSIEAAWKNEKFEKLRDNWQNGKIPECCVECTHYHPATNLIPAYKNQLFTPRVIRKVKRTVKYLPRKIACFFKLENTEIILRKVCL